MADSAVLAIFEAAFEWDRVWVRVDLLERQPSGSWSIGEVKSSTKVKPEHIQDLAVQTYVAEGCGIVIDRARLIHVDTSYVRGPAAIDWHSYFRIVDVTDEVRASLTQIPSQVSAMHQVLAQEQPPSRRPSTHCFKPFECEFWIRCTAAKPTDWIWYLPRLTPERFSELEDIGIEAISHIPSDFPLTVAQRRVVDAFRKGGFIVQSGLGQALAASPSQTMYLDFETFSPGIPLYPGTRPYQRLPVQWSLHTETSGGDLSHHEFLAEMDVDPRRAFSESLLNAVEDDCPVMVYSGFEASVLKELAAHLPDLKDPLQRLILRLVDMLPWVRNFVDHPGFKGSNSIKDVAPVLTSDVNYKELGDLAEGGAAAAAIYRLGTGQLDIGETRESLRAALLRYCALDTVAMVKVRKALVSLQKQTEVAV